MASLNLNERAGRVADELSRRAMELGAVVHDVGGAMVIDAGVAVPGSLGAGLLLARACLADLGEVSLVPGRIGDHPLAAVVIAVHQPVAACMASQYAGWQISVGDYFAMGSGPMRAAAAREPLFNEPALLPYREKPARVVGILETSKLPTEQVVKLIAERCSDTTATPGNPGAAAPKVALLCARTASIAGSVQVVARSVETALHKLHALGFDLTRVVAGFGSAPLPPVARHDMAGIGRTNDAVLYGGQVTLHVTGDDDSLAQLGARLPASTSPDYGRPFYEIFKRCNNDFYKIDPMLFSPAIVSLQNIATGKTVTFGRLNHEVLAESFFK